MDAHRYDLAFTGAPQVFPLLVTDICALLPAANFRHASSASKVLQARVLAPNQYESQQGGAKS